MVICFITQQLHQNHWSQHQRHLLLRLLRVAALEEQQHWQVLGWSCGGNEMTINIEWQDQHGNWHHYQSKQNQADAYRVAQRRAESTGKRHRLVDGANASEVEIKQKYIYYFCLKLMLLTNTFGCLCRVRWLETVELAGNSCKLIASQTAETSRFSTCSTSSS